MPNCCQFGPIDKMEKGQIDMTVDEFESIRLIDLEGFTQEECANRMQVARTTAQAIYNSARVKLAECVVNGKRLHITGGDYVLCGSQEQGCGCRHCPKKVHHPMKREEQTMILAIPYDNGAVFQHFGKSEAFKIYEIDAGKVTASRVVSTNGNGHGALAGMLKELGVSALICGGIGGGARSALGEQSIEIFGGVTGEADKAAQDYLAGILAYNPDAACNHHHEEGHTCSGHGE